MTYTEYTAAQAVARANNTTSWQTAMCLNFVMNMLTPGVRSPYYNQLSDANAAWTYAQQKETTGTPPAGAPVYFAGYSHGHIALSLGGGQIRSTDIPNLGQVGTTTIGDIERSWGITYRGWSRDYAGLTISGLEATSTAYSPIPTATTSTTGGLTVSEYTDLMAAINNLAGQESDRYKAYAGWHDDLAAKLNTLIGQESGRYTAYSGWHDDLAGKLNTLTGQESGRYTDYVARFTAVTDALNAVKTELDALKAEVDALPKA